MANIQYVKLIEEKNRGLLLIIVGVLLIAFSMGQLEVKDTVKFIPSQDLPNVCLYIAIAIGTFLILTGIILILHQKEILKPVLRKLFFLLATIVVLSVSGVVVGMRFFPAQTPNVIQCYAVDDSSLQVYLAFWKIRNYTRDHENKLLLVTYRKRDPAIMFAEDPNIYIKLSMIGKEDMEAIMVPFTSEFSRALTPGADMLDFALWLCPKDVRLTDIKTSLDLERYGGELLETASTTVQTQHSWSGRHCPQFLSKVNNLAIFSLAKIPIVQKDEAVISCM